MDLTVVNLKTTSAEGSQDFIIGSADLPYDRLEPPPTWEMVRAGSADVHNRLSRKSTSVELEEHQSQRKR